MKPPKFAAAKFECFKVSLSPLSFCSGLYLVWNWAHPLLQIGVKSEINNRMISDVDPDETACWEPSHLDLHTGISFWSAWLKELRCLNILGICMYKGICILKSIRTDCCLTQDLLNSDMPCLCKQCRSSSFGFFRSQLIWICTVWH